MGPGRDRTRDPWICSPDSFKNGCCQLQAKVCARITGYPLVQACPGKSVIRCTDRPAMTIAVYYYQDINALRIKFPE